MDLEGVMLSEMSQTENDKSCMILPTCKSTKPGLVETAEDGSYQGLGSGEWGKILNGVKVQLEHG